MEDGGEYVHLPHLLFLPLFFVVHSFFHFGGVVVVILGIINHVVKSRTCMMDLYWTYVGSMLEKYSDDIGHALG